MGQTHIFLLLLSIVALSSSSVLPISMNQFNKESVDIDGQYNDNTFSNNYQPKNVLNEIYRLYVAKENTPATNKLQIIYADGDNNRDADILSIFNKNDNYNGEGFRKEQWHNYPRQLDRLHQIYELKEGKRNDDPDLSKEQYSEEVSPNNPNTNDLTNGFHLQSNTGTNNYDAVISANPLFILKVRLACLNKDVDRENIHYSKLMTSELEPSKLGDEEINDIIDNENPVVNVLKVKREGISSTQNSELSDTPSTEVKTVNKRIFSLWSRLQSLNHKGHELQHRRHLHAFYGLPDSDGGGTLTAETRATFMRPPGSPLRWG